MEDVNSKTIEMLKENIKWHEQQMEEYLRMQGKIRARIKVQLKNSKTDVAEHVEYHEHGIKSLVNALQKISSLLPDIVDEIDYCKKQVRDLTSARYAAWGFEIGKEMKQDV